MSQELSLHTMEDVVQWLNERGFMGVYSEYEKTYLIYDKDRTGLRIAVFPEDYGHPKLQGCVAAETNKTFDKWTTAYLVRDYPQTTEEFDLLLSDLKLIRHPIHVDRANQYEPFDRNPPDPNRKQYYRNYNGKRNPKNRR